MNKQNRGDLVRRFAEDFFVSKGFHWDSIDRDLIDGFILWLYKNQMKIVPNWDRFIDKQGGKE